MAFVPMYLAPRLKKMYFGKPIPFREWFLIPYVFWYGLIVFSLGWFLLHDIVSFRRLQTFIIVTQLVAMAAYILVPTRQDLRPEVFPRDNALTQCIALLYRFDTNTGVCPSLHVAYSLGIASVWLRRRTPLAGKIFVVAAVVLDHDSLTVTKDGVSQELPQKEFMLLSYPGKIFTRIQLMDEIWGAETNTGWEEFSIESVRGLGYKAVKKI